jgi:CRISPR/Cas system-associated protein endoribonuclease Cas2
MPVTENHETRITRLEVTMQGVEKNLEHINNNLSKIVWLIITAMAIAVMKLVLGGGV